MSANPIDNRQFTRELTEIPDSAASLTQVASIGSKTLVSELCSAVDAAASTLPPVATAEENASTRTLGFSKPIANDGGPQWYPVNGEETCRSRAAAGVQARQETRAPA